ncbi:hypothetical protein G5714_019187 [Onychostoma macrolepis]|uniref:Uncharacterized protein n=1 Tax=Onychostoma macrolepis TaxID=369639 RepID=A0A7J6C1R1_9TELE|nr:hypothetical protein G5714_019187 [Onychostoma macrolepis]
MTRLHLIKPSKACWGKPLTQSQRKLMAQVRSANADDEVALVGSIVIKQKDLITLTNLCEVEGNVLNSCFCVLQQIALSQNVDIYPVDSHAIVTWLPPICAHPMDHLPPEIMSKDAVVFPSWVPGHWMLCVLEMALTLPYTEKLLRACVLGHGQNSILRTLGIYLDKRESCSCGVFILMYVILGGTFDFSESDIPSIRRWWSVLLLKKFPPRSVMEIQQRKRRRTDKPHKTELTNHPTMANQGTKRKPDHESSDSEPPLTTGAKRKPDHESSDSEPPLTTDAKIISKAKQIMTRVTDNLVHTIIMHKDIISKINKMNTVNRKKETIGIFGKSGEGKSYLLSAILGKRNLLPSGCFGACTAVLTQVEANLTDSNYTAEIELFSKEEWEEQLNKLHTIVSDENAERNEDFEIAEEKITALYGADAVEELMGPGGECKSINFICTKTDEIDPVAFMRAKRLTGIQNLEEKEKKKMCVSLRNECAKKSVKEKFENSEIKKRFSTDNTFLQVFSVSSKAFFDTSLNLESTETEIPKLQDDLRNLNKSINRQLTREYINEAKGVMSLIQSVQLDKDKKAAEMKNSIRKELGSNLKSIYNADSL